MAQVFNMYMARNLCRSISGSGLDTEPDITQSERNVVIRWDYHITDDAGFYRAYWRFTVWVPKANPLDFRLSGRRGNTRISAVYGVKAYLEEMLAGAMVAALGSVSVTAELCGDKWLYGGSVDADV